MSEINVMDNLSGIDFSRETREKVAEVLAAFVADQVAEKMEDEVSSKSAADKIDSEQAPAEELTSVQEPRPAAKAVHAVRSKGKKKAR